MKKILQISPLDKEEADELIKNGADPKDFYLEVDDDEEVKTTSKRGKKDVDKG